MPTASHTLITNVTDLYSTGINQQDSLIDAWKRGIRDEDKVKMQADLTAKILAAFGGNLGDIVLSGFTITDGGASNSKVNVTAGVVLRSGVATQVAAINLLAVTNTQHVYVSSANVIAAGASVPGGGIDLGTVAVSAGNCTPTHARPRVSITTVAD